MSGIAAFFGALLLCVSAASAQLSVHFIDVGQGDSTYIELPNGQNVLIDGGPAGTPVTNFLKNRGVTTIDHVVLTHPHSDHYMGLKMVFRNFHVRNFYDTRVDNLDARGDNEVRRLAREEGSWIHYPEVGEHLRWDYRVTVKILNSCPEELKTRDSRDINNCSIVTRFYYNGHGVLLTGDIEASVENAMTRLFKSGLDSTYLKVSHHGSKYSSAPKFLARVRPQVAVISAGADNNHGHPHKEAIDRLLAAGAQIYTTLDGDQSLTIPAPKRGVAMMVDGEIVLPVTVNPQDFRMADYPYDPADAAAMEQLKEAAGE